MIDRDRTALYAAELAAFDGTDLEARVDIERLQALAAQVVDAGWWPGGPVEVRRARADASTSTTRCAVAANPREVAVVRISAPQCTVATLAHELAHALVGAGQGHGAVYRRAYLDIVRVVTNLDTTDRRRDLHERQLADAFAAAGLPVGRRSWPAPPADSGGAFAL